MKRLSRYVTMMCFFIRGGFKRGEYARKKGYFKRIGEHVFLQPYNFGTEPERISFGNNVHIASGVTFVTHDVTSFMFNYMDKNHTYEERFGDISIGDNVFIGANTTILYDVTIGNNVIIGAGSIVCKDIPSGTIAAGVPAKVIGNFDDYRKKLMKDG